MTIQSLTLWNQSKNYGTALGMKTVQRDEWRTAHLYHKWSYSCLIPMEIKFIAALIWLIGATSMPFSVALIFAPKNSQILRFQLKQM